MILSGRAQSDVELLFGLDMLRRHQCCIDLRENALIIQDRKIPFLAEHELPKGKAEEFELDACVLLDCARSEAILTLSSDTSNGDPVPVGTKAASLSNAAAQASNAAGSSSANASGSTSSFPGSGRSLGASPSSAAPLAKRVKSNSPTPASNTSSSTPSAAAPPAPRASAPPGISEEAISSLVNLGADRATAVRLLEAAGGNAEVAASLLFSG